MYGEVQISKLSDGGFLICGRHGYSGVDRPLEKVTATKTLEEALAAVGKMMGAKAEACRGSKPVVREIEPDADGRNYEVSRPDAA